MKNKYILNLFIAFLKQNKVYDDYLYILSKGVHYRFNYNKNWLKPEDFIIETIQRSPNDLISNAYDWGNCQHSIYKKWWELNYKWEDIIYNKFGL